MQIMYCTSLQVGPVRVVTQSAIEFRYDCVAGRLAKVESLTESPFGARGLSKMLFIQPYNVNGLVQIAREMTQGQ